MYCYVCGEVDEYYDENDQSMHLASPKHKCNVILANYKSNKRQFSKNKEGLYIFCDATSEPLDNIPENKVENCDHHKIRINAYPRQNVKFSFKISSDMKNEDVLIVGIQLAHPQPQFSMNNHPFVFGGQPHTLLRKSTVQEEVSVSFKAEDIGHFEMPIMFTFHRPSDKKNIIFIREMVIMVQETFNIFPFVKSHYTNQNWDKPNILIPCTEHKPYEIEFKIPKLLKTLFPMGLNEDALLKLNVDAEVKAQLRAILISTRNVFDMGITEDNYMMYFHYLLWWEEIIARINLRKYNMSEVKIQLQSDDTFWLEVDGLAEKRPSLLRGDRVFLRPVVNTDISFECIIGNIKDNSIQLSYLDDRFDEYYSEEALFNVRFLMSRVPAVRMHAAVSAVFTAGHECRIFPKKAKKTPKVQTINKFYNKLIKENAEQRSAVEHIVSRTSGRTPYIVFGPPGTGKTMTIVEAIIQIVVQNPKHRVLVCTDSNMAADHIAMMLLKYHDKLNVHNFIFRANSKNREWNIMPPELVAVSNGSSYNNSFPVSNEHAGMYRVLVTTLLHAAKYGSERAQSRYRLEMSHVFIDEAAQAREPAALVPVSALLAPHGQLVLAGDPRQLGPVCLSKEAAERGLGISLLERLWSNYPNIYRDNPNFITTLVQNFRSHPDILIIPNTLFYPDKPLQSKAKLDPLSEVSILGLKGGNRAVVFHSVNSREQRMGSSPSYYNEKELAMLQRYIKALVTKHNISTKDIGIIAPYIRQVYKMREWLKHNEYEDVEIGTVESFQGKEKRVILVSTVRANCRLLDYDAKYGLGFLVDDKRFNVALTRAKAKLIIIGNPACLRRDDKWRAYMELCEQGDSYFGKETEQLERNSGMLTEIARTRFDRCRLTEALDAALKEYKAKNKEKEY